MNFRQRVTVVLTALAVLLGIAAVAVTPASASSSQCSGNSTVCFWSDSGYNGNFYQENQLTEGYCYNVAGWFNDQASSVWNKSGGWLQIFPHANCETDWFYGWRYFSDGGYDDNLDEFGADMNDMLSSFRRCSTSGGCF